MKALLKSCRALRFFFIHVDGPCFFIFGFSRVKAYDPLFEVYLIPCQIQDLS